MLKKFFSSLSLLIFLNVIVKPVWIFGIDRQVQNIAGTEAFGHYFAIFNLAFILNFLLDLGLSTYNNQQIASGKLKSSDSFAPLSFLKLLLGLAYAIVLIIVAFLIGITDIYLLLLIGITQFLFSVLVFLRSTITALQLFSLDALLSVFDKLIVIIIAGLFIYFPSVTGTITILNFVFIQALAVSASVIITSVIILVKQKMEFKPRLDLKFLKNALPYAFVVLCMSALSRQDAVILERLNADGKAEAGVYAGAFRLLDACNMAGYLFASFLLPFIAKNLGNSLVIKKAINLSRNSLLLFALLVCLITWLYRFQIQELLYRDHSRYSSDVLAITMFALPGYCLVQMYGTFLTAAGRINTFLNVTILFMLISMTLNLYFTPIYGAMACAVIAVCTQIMYGCTLAFLSKIENNIDRQ